MRVLKHHEKKLLKKVDFFNWKEDQNLREAQVIRKFRLQDREDYSKYSKVVGLVTKLVAKLRDLKQDDPLRQQISEQMLQKLHGLGLIDKTSSLSAAERLTVSRLCLRRLPVVMVKCKMAQSIKEAATMVEQGHVRVGPQVVTDPAFLVSRPFEDFVTWVDSSRIKRAIQQYHDKVDDYDLLGN
eukprot:gene7788-8599_t